MSKISDILSNKNGNVYCVAPSATAYEALALMAEKNIGAVLVMEGHEIKGIFTERDYARKIVLRGKSSKDSSVSEYMTAQVVCFTPQNTVEECMAKMTLKRIRHIPIVENNHVLGVISMGDVVKHIISQQEVTIKDLENYIAGVY